MSGVANSPSLVNYSIASTGTARDPAPGTAEHDLLHHWDGPLLVTGGPGSGKTTLVVQAAAAATSAVDGPPPLVLTWSRAAASDLRNRISRALGLGTSQPSVATVHSLCRSLVERFGGREGWRLLTAPEQEFRVRELLAGQAPGLWPQALQQAVTTREFARQVRAVLARARQLGLDPQDVERFGREAGLAEWIAFGRFFAEYLDVLDHENALDYAELVHRARILLTDDGVIGQVRGEVGAVIIDEYGECDPAQIGLLRALVPDGGRILATGDPDQTVNAFRGAHPRALAEFPTVFTRADGAPALVRRLDVRHRLPAAVAGAVASVRVRLPQHPVIVAARPFGDESPARRPRPGSTDGECPGLHSARRGRPGALHRRGDPSDTPGRGDRLRRHGRPRPERQKAARADRSGPGRCGGAG